MHNLNIEFTFDDNFSELSDTIIKAVGKECTGSGAGLGIRDMSFEFELRSEALEAKQKIQQLKIPGMKIDIEHA